VAKVLPQLRQKRAPARLGLPQAAQVTDGVDSADGLEAGADAASARATAPAAGMAGSSGVAHFLQNLAMGRLPVPHAGQVLDKGKQRMDGAVVHRRRRPRPACARAGRC
jgi:hypothetical protein